MALEFVAYDPVTDTRVSYRLPKPDGNGNFFFGITVKKLMGELIGAIATKTGMNPVQIMTSQDAQKFVIRIEPVQKGENK